MGLNRQIRGIGWLVMNPIATRGCRFRCLAFALLLILGGNALNAKEDQWLKLTTPEFTVITSLKEKEATAWAGEFGQFIAAMRGFFKYGNRPLAPLTVVIFAREKDFLGYRPLGTDHKPQDVAGFFSRRAGSAVAGLSTANEPEELRRVIFHEGTHWFMSSFDEYQPVWVAEGLAEVFSTFEVEKGKAKWGSPIGEHVMVLRELDRLPLAQLLATGQGELFHGNSIKTGIVYAESWAFVHYLLFGQHKIPREALAQYVDLARTALHPDEAFKQAFGRSMADMDREFRRYLDGGSYFVSHQPLAVVPPPQVMPATAVDVSTALSKLALAAGRTELAEKHARAVIAAAPEAPEGYDLLGLTLKLKNDAAGARAAFTESVAKNSRDFEAYFELALAEQLAAVDDGNLIQAMPPATARRIANHYEQAINIEHRFQPSYQNLAGILNLVEPLRDTDRAFIEFGRKLYPEDRMIEIGLAVFEKHAGDDAKARTLLDEVMAAPSQPPEVRTFAAHLDAAWEQQEIIDRTNALAGDNKFSEAADYVSQRLAKGVHPSIRAQFVELRRQLAVSARSLEIKTALEERRWDEARTLINGVLESDSPVAFKKYAQRSLDDLNRQKLGVPPEASP